MSSSLNELPRVTVVKFGAKWCKPCLESEPAYKNVQKDYSGKAVDFYSVDIDNPDPQLPAKISDVITKIESIPFIMVFPPQNEESIVIKPWKEDDVRLAIESVLYRPSPRKNENFIKPGTFLDSSEEEELDMYLDGISDQEDSAEEFKVVN